MAIIIDGKKVAEKVIKEVRGELLVLRKQKVFPSIIVVLVGNDPASEIYVNSKEKKAKELGIISNRINLPASTTEKELLSLIGKLNRDKKINAILVQFPLPNQINERKVRDAISPMKDVDGLNAVNAGKLQDGDEILAPCTPKGVIRLLTEIDVSIEGKTAVIIGRSALVGKPIANMLLNRNATITICHSKTRNLGEITKNADLLVVAVGKPHLITSNMVKEGAVVIDVGTSRLQGKDGKTNLVGDVDFEAVGKKVRAITPVPGGVGPMTIAMLMQNTINCTKLQHGLI